MMHTELYCRSLESVDRVELIRAVHEAWLQISALTKNVDCEHYDNKPVMGSLSDCLAKAGHPGFSLRTV